MTDLASEIAQLRRHQVGLVRLLARRPPAALRPLIVQTLVVLLRQQRRLERLAKQSQKPTLLPPSAVEWALVRSVPDGDGVRLADGRRVRYLGIDAPEIGGQGQPPQPWAKEAKAFNQALVVGRRVRLVRDVSDVDAHGRLLRYVFCDGLFVNAQLLLAGLATLMVVPPDTRYAELLALCELAARQAGVGMWRQLWG